MPHTIKALLLILTAWLLPLQPLMAADDGRYTTCTELTRLRPDEALKMAERWMQEEASASAYHCRAISLFALKRYADAGHALEELSGQITNKNMVLWSNVLRQAGKAWELSGDKARALVALTKAIQPTADAGLENPALARMAAELLLDRSLLYQAGNRPLYAMQDLDQALSLAPKHQEVLLARARLLVKQNESELAAKDIETLLKLSPRHAGALKLKSQLMQAKPATR